MNRVLPIRKLYFDAVDPAGRHWIGYKLDWAALGLRWTYRELSGARLDGRAWRLSLSKAPARWEAPETSFNFATGRAAALWNPPSYSWPHAFENEVLRWELTGFGGKFEAQPDDGGGYTTYCECVTLKQRPWALGIESLRWGRLVVDGLFVTWIIADGARPIAFSAVNAQSFTTGVHWAGDTLTTPAGQLTLGLQRSVISKGDVSEERRGLTAVLARWMFGRGGIHQRKGAFDCTMRLADGTIRQGVAIAEEVKFLGLRTWFRPSPT